MRKILIALFFLSAFSVGCATHEPMYYWGNYSQSLYKYKKTPTPENQAAHKAVLVKIIEESDKNSKRVPPGVCCEYGYILLKEGNTQEALRYFDLEEKAYPESKAFLDRLRSRWLKEKEDKP